MTADEIGPDALPEGLAALLRRAAQGDREARDAVFGALYGELHRLASREMSGQPHDHTLQTTALLHEAWLRLTRGAVAFADRSHLMGLAARAMRSVLVDYARARAAVKRGGGVQPVAIDGTVGGLPAAHPVDVLALEEALERLEAADAQLARLVELRFFGGLAMPEAAAALGLSLPTAERRWRAARAFLRVALGE